MSVNCNFLCSDAVSLEFLHRALCSDSLERFVCRLPLRLSSFEIATGFLFLIRILSVLSLTYHSLVFVHIFQRFLQINLVLARTDPFISTYAAASFSFAYLSFARAIAEADVALALSSDPDWTTLSFSSTLASSFLASSASLEAS